MPVLNKVSVPIKQGDRNRLTFTATQSDGSPLNLTGAVIEFSVAEDYDSETGWTWKSDESDQVEILDPENGRIRVTLLPQDSRAWGRQLTLLWELTVEFSPTDRLTVSEGTFAVSREVRNAG